MINTEYICSKCGVPVAKWVGRCPSCGEWETIVGRAASWPPRDQSASSAKRVAGIDFDPRVAPYTSVPVAPDISPVETEIDAVPITEVDLTDIEARYITGVDALDHVLGGGLVLGAPVLLGADPGAGKSTVLIQAAAGAARWNELVVLYATGEESIAQVAMRAKRVGALYDRVRIVHETNPDRILALAQKHGAEILVIDSISTMAKPENDAAPGSVTQVRACAEQLCAYAKATGACLVMIAHVTKDGAVAGPNTLKHLVDVVLHLDVVARTPYRVLRAYKNRHGDTNLVGRLQMGDEGLVSLREDDDRAPPAERETADPTAPEVEPADPEAVPGESHFEIDYPLECPHLYGAGRRCELCGAQAPAAATA